MNMFKCLPTLVLLLISHISFSQTTAVEPGVTNLFKLNFFAPGISYEQKVAKFQTLHISGFVSTTFSTSQSNDGTNLDVFLFPSISAQYRSYYNIPKLTRKGISTGFNSGSYIAPVYFGTYSFYDDRMFNQIGAVWGVQRTASGGFSIDINLGVSYTFQNEGYQYFNSDFGPILNLALGFRI